MNVIANLLAVGISSACIALGIGGTRPHTLLPHESDAALRDRYGLTDHQISVARLAVRVCRNVEVAERSELGETAPNEKVGARQRREEHVESGSAIAAWECECADVIRLPRWARV